MMKTILYIEDDAVGQRLVVKVLQRAGYQVLIADNGLEGIDLARTHQPDLILTDINLPDISGFEIATYLRNDPRFADTPIVALTARDSQDIAMAAGITGYLAKPVNITLLVERIEFYLAGGRDAIDADVLSRGQGRYIKEVVGRLEERIRKLEQANVTLRKLDRMKETFIQITAHELRTPLTLVFGYSRLLADQARVQQLKTEDDTISVLVEGLLQAVERMSVTINEILVISRIMTDQIELSFSPTSMASLVRKLLASYEGALLERSIVLEYDLGQWPREAFIDEELMRVALSNLVSNAIKFTPDGGRIYLQAFTYDDHVRISLRDTGVGIDLAEQEHIFDEFHVVTDIELHSSSKTAFNGGGMGLGLPVSRGIIEAHGGEIWVESAGYNPESCPGSEFVILLPLNAHSPSTTSLKGYSHE